MYDLYEKIDSLQLLSRLKKEWEPLKTQNEFTWLKPTETKSFLKYFSKRLHEQISYEQKNHEQKSQELAFLFTDTNMYEQQIKHSSHNDLPELKTPEDALIWLDCFSKTPEKRQELCTKIYKGWGQYKYREGANKTQKNIILEKPVADQLTELSKKHDYSESKIVSMLIKAEHKNNTSISGFIDEANAVMSHLKSEQ